MKDFVQEYLDSMCACLRDVSYEDIEKVTQKLLLAYEENAVVFIAGNGGSASAASHLACDLAKTTLGPNPRDRAKRFKTISLVDNVSLMTAWGNDEGYEYIFSEQLKNLARKEDLLVVISASGNSSNILNALETARSLGMYTAGLLGFGGGKAKELIDESVIIKSYDYGHVEGAHSVLAHMMASFLSQALK